MTDRIRFDKSYWPKAGTLVPSIPQDLNDLWIKYEDQLSVLIAEALISDPPRFRVNLQENDPQIETFLWNVGGDCITVSEPLIHLISESATDYDRIRSTEQAQDIEERLANLQKIEDSIDQAKKHLVMQLDEFRQMQETPS